jgi:hypothetical protein
MSRLRQRSMLSTSISHQIATISELAFHGIHTSRL